MADERQNEYLKTMMEDNRSFFRRAVVDVLAETLRGGMIGAGMAGTVAHIRVPLMLFGAGAAGGYEAYKQIATAISGREQNVQTGPSTPGRNPSARAASAALLTGGFSLAGDVTSRAFGVPYSARDIAVSSLIAAATGAAGDIVANNLREFDRVAATRGGYFALMASAADDARTKARTAMEAIGTTIGNLAWRRTAPVAAAAAAEAPRSNLLGPVDARTIAMANARNAQAAALQERLMARVRGERETARDASRRFRHAVLAQRAQAADVRLPPLQRQWRRTRDGRTHIVTRREFWR